MNIPFKAIPSQKEELSNETSAKDYVLDLARLKARDVFSKLSDEKSGDQRFVIGSDTIVVLEGKILEKPRDINHARELLKSLSGKTHEVYTAVAFKTSLKEQEFYQISKVTFESIEDELLEDYLLTKDSLDKAGAYGIQGMGLSFISHLDGSYSNVVGFPLSEVYQKMRHFFELRSGESLKDCFLLNE